MSGTIIRTGLWSFVLILVAYVLKENAPHTPIAQIIEDGLLLILFQVSIGLVVLGVLVRFLEKMNFGRSNRCQVCNVKIPAGSIYCRIHLNEVLEEEELRKRTMSQRLPD